MKRFLIVFIALFLLSFIGCAAVAPGQDAYAVNGERALKSSVIAIDAVLTVESQNRQLVKSKAPAVAAALDQIRINGPAVIKSAEAALRAYEDSGASADKAAADKALAAVDAIVATAQSYLAEIHAAL